MPVLLFWGLGSFLFYKVSFDISFDRDLSVLAAFALCVVLMISVHFSSYFYATQMGKHIVRIRFSQTSDFFQKSFLIFGMTAFLNIVLGKLIVFAFSKEINRELGREVFFNFGKGFNDYREEGLIFIFLVVLPITVHFAAIILSLYLQNKCLKEQTKDIE